MRARPLFGVTLRDIRHSTISTSSAANNGTAIRPYLSSMSNIPGGATIVSNDWPPLKAAVAISMRSPRRWSMPAAAAIASRRPAASSGGMLLSSNTETDSRFTSPGPRTVFCVFFETS